MSKLILAHHIEHIALILGLINSFFKKIISRFISLNPGIMAGHHIITLQYLGPLKKLFKFHVTVTVYTWVRSNSLLVALNKFFYDVMMKIILEVEYKIVHTKLISYTPGIIHIIKGTACMRPGNSCILIVIKMHCTAYAFVSFLLHQKGGNAGIHPAAHGNQSPLHPFFTSPLETAISYPALFTRRSMQYRHCSETSPVHILES